MILVFMILYYFIVLDGIMFEVWRIYIYIYRRLNVFLFLEIIDVCCKFLNFIGICEIENEVFYNFLR